MLVEFSGSGFFIDEVLDSELSIQLVALPGFANEESLIWLFCGIICFSRDWSQSGQCILARVAWPIISRVQINLTKYRQQLFLFNSACLPQYDITRRRLKNRRVFFFRNHVTAYLQYSRCTQCRPVIYYRWRNS